MTGLRDVLEHPATIGLGAALALLGIGQGGLVWAFLSTLWASAGTLFTVSSISAFTLFPELPWIPGWVTQAATALALLSGGVFILKLGRRVWNNFERRLQ